MKSMMTGSFCKAVELASILFDTCAEITRDATIRTVLGLVEQKIINGFLSECHLYELCIFTIINYLFCLGFSTSSILSAIVPATGIVFSVK